MASTSDRSDPFLAFRFEVRIDDLKVGGFMECSGLQLETEVQDFAEGGLNTHVRKFPTRTKQSNIILKRGIVDRELYGWYDEIVVGRMHRRNGSIIVHHPSRSSVAIEWQLQRAFPCKWIGPDLNATQSSVAVETIELCHEGLVRRT